MRLGGREESVSQQQRDRNELSEHTWEKTGKESAQRQVQNILELPLRVLVAPHVYHAEMWS